jgi:hypothetical protein
MGGGEKTHTFVLASCKEYAKYVKYIDINILYINIQITQNTQNMQILIKTQVRRIRIILPALSSGTSAPYEAIPTIPNACPRLREGPSNFRSLSGLRNDE